MDISQIRNAYYFHVQCINNEDNVVIVGTEARINLPKSGDYIVSVTYVTNNPDIQYGVRLSVIKGLDYIIINNDDGEFTESDNHGFDIILIYY